MGLDSAGKMPRGTFEGNSSHDGDGFRASRRRNPAGISASRRRHQLDLLRLGRAALFHIDHHFCLRALFRGLRRAGSGTRAGDVGICYRGRRPDDRAAVSGAGRDCGCQRTPQAMDRGLRRAAGDWRLVDVVRKAGRSECHPGAAARLCDRKRRRRIRHRLQQRDDADAGAAGPNRTIVRHRWATGYIGGILSLILVLGFLAANPDTGRTLLGLAPLFGLDVVSHQGDRITGPLTGIWFIIFVLPMFLLTPDYPARRPIRAAIREGLSGLKRTLGELPKQKSLATFLLANMIYTDGLVSLFAFGGIYAAGTFGWHTIQIGSFGILLAIAGTFGAWLGGKLDDSLGPKRVIAGSMLILLLSIIAILLVDKDSILFVKVAAPVPGGALFSGAAERAYLVLGCLIGAAGGPLQAASRSLLIRLAPQDRIAQYFGLFALTGKVTAFIGPLLIGAITAITASQKAGMAALVVFFVTGLALLARVRD